MSAGEGSDARQAEGAADAGGALRRHGCLELVQKEEEVLATGGVVGGLARGAAAERGELHVQPAAVVVGEVLGDELVGAGRLRPWRRLVAGRLGDRVLQVTALVWLVMFGLGAIGV